MRINSTPRLIASSFALSLALSPLSLGADGETISHDLESNAILSVCTTIRTQEFFTQIKKTLLYIQEVEGLNIPKEYLDCAYTFQVLYSDYLNVYANIISKEYEQKDIDSIKSYIFELVKIGKELEAMVKREQNIDPYFAKMMINDSKNLTNGSSIFEPISSQAKKSILDFVQNYYTDISKDISGDSVIEYLLNLYKELKKNIPQEDLQYFWFAETTLKDNTPNNPELETILISPGKYIFRFQKFSKAIAEKFRTEVEKLRPQEIILDLRNNSGGDPNEAAKIADIFLDGLLYSDQALYDESTISVFGYERNIKGIDIKILISQNTFSAAELLAGILQNAGYKLYGEQTYGKNTTVYSLSFSNNTYEYTLDIPTLKARNPLSPLYPDKGISEILPFL